MKIVFIDGTPLAGLAAMEHVTLNSGGGPVALENAEFLTLPENLFAAGEDAGGHEVYAMWLPASGELLARLAESYIKMHRLPPDACRIVRVHPRGIVLRMASLLYSQGLAGLARRLLLWRYRRGIDGVEVLVDNG
ncbi:MAG: hypothetical protein QME76_02275 [Bacillota bacterium]|nr:hypothetical protein [Bacillota bacterium]